MSRTSRKRSNMERSSLLVVWLASSARLEPMLVRTSWLACLSLTVSSTPATATDSSEKATAR